MIALVRVVRKSSNSMQEGRCHPGKFSKVLSTPAKTVPVQMLEDAAKADTRLDPMVNGAGPFQQICIHQPLDWRLRGQYN